jgi:hypothetical protein
MMHLPVSLALILYAGSLDQAQVREPTIQTVCDVVKHPKLWNGRTITVRSYVEASQHSIVLTGAACGQGIYLSHESGKSDGKWPAFDDALMRKATGLDKRPLQVLVRGVYSAHLPHGTKAIRQLDVLEVLDLSFEKEAKSLAPSIAK